MKNRGKCHHVVIRMIILCVVVLVGRGGFCTLDFEHIYNKEEQMKLYSQDETNNNIIGREKEEL